MDSLGRRNKETPVADATTVVKIILLLPGEQAAKVREHVSEVFVRFLGGDASLVREVLQNREMQELLRRDAPEHWARFFGEAVEAAADEASPPPSQEMMQRACEAVMATAVPMLTRLVDEIAKQQTQ